MLEDIREQIYHENPTYWRQTRETRQEKKKSSAISQTICTPKSMGQLGARGMGLFIWKSNAIDIRFPRNTALCSGVS